MSETKRYGSIDALCGKILSEAEQYETELLREYEKKAEEAQKAVLSRAEEKASSELSAAKSARDMRARSARLKVKTELLETAYRAAEEKIAHLPKAEYLALFVPYLNEAIAQKPKGKARLAVGKSSPVDAKTLLSEAQNTEEIEILSEEKPFFCGFSLETDEISFDCSAHALIEGIRSETEPDVIRILFGEE